MAVNSRRDFIKKSVSGSAALFAGGLLPGMSAASYARVVGANEKIRASVMGVNSRGKVLAKNFARQDRCEIAHVCDVDSRAVEKCLVAVAGRQSFKPKGYKDFRKSLESKDIDILIVAAPDHWHAPAALLAMQAGKHVYLEKPCGHNPNEGEILIAAASKYDRVIQMGNQRRSWPNVVKGIQELRDGAIGRPYFGKGWYANNRDSIGVGKEVDAPDWLDWDLWQGPAPRKKYKDNLLHYNWHWHWHWGTGEALNNGTHMIDLLRWGMEVDYPVKVSSNGGRYRYQDDWETPDTQVINLDFDENVSMTWEGRSCNGRHIEGYSVGAMFYGEEGSLLISGGNSYKIYDLENKLVKKVEGNRKINPQDPANPAEQLDGLHIRNFFDGILNGTKLNAGIEEGHISTLLVQLGNIAQRTGHSLDINPENGHIVGNKDAERYWQRTYENGWEMKL